MGARKGQAADAKSAVRSVAAPAGFGMILQRARVHALIEARLPGAVWLHGPTGAGKTIALRTYLEQAGLSSLWLTLDDRHREPSALFAAITGMAHVPRAALPSFSPEHRDAPAAFARDYFAKLDEALPPQQVLVVDDAHLADQATALFVEAIDVLGDRRRVFFASQLLPGPRFAPSLAGARLFTIGYRQLAFDADEARGLAHRLGTELPMVDALLAATDGWAAGLMLAMQLGPPSSDDTGDPLGSLRNPLAHLIATQVLRGVEPDEFRRLRVLADLPQVPMALVDVANDWEPACAHLNRLADRGLFVERIANERAPSTSAGGSARIAKGSWRLHDLFRAALHEAGAERGTDPTLARTLVTSLIDIERLDLAWQVAAANDPSVLDELIDAHGSTALHDVDLPLLREASARCVPASPALSYWRARALLGSDERAALASAEAAWVGYDEQSNGDRKGLSVALAIFATFSSIENVRAIEPWITRFENVVRDDGRSAMASDERAIRCAAEVMHDMHFAGRGGSVDASAMQDRLLAWIVADVLPPDETMLAGSLLVAAMDRANRLTDADAAIVRIGSLPAAFLAAPHIRAAWFLECGYHHVRVGSTSDGRRAFEECLSVANDNALPQTRVGALIGLVRSALASNDQLQAGAAFEQIGSVGMDGGSVQSAQVLDLRARMELATGQPQRALGSNEAARKLMVAFSFPAVQLRALDMSRLQMLHVLGRHDEVEALGGRLMTEGAPVDRERTDVTLGLLRADRDWDSHPIESESLLRKSILAAQQLNVVSFIPLLPQVAGQAAARALRLGVAVDFVRRAIRARRLPAPAASPRDWPWPFRVRLLGRFVIERVGVPMVFTGKAQQKPLELLKFLACERTMTSDARSITNALWPDADGESGRKSLEVTVSRLRKLLEDDTLIVVKEGRVALDASRISSDAREFTELCSACEAAMAQPASRSRAAELGTSLLAVFEGLPLEHDDSLTWREGTREKFRSALVRAVRALAASLEESNQSVRAIALLEAAIEREPLAEVLYQLLMRGYLRIGEHAEAMRIYRQCRQMLSVLIGGTPSAETERIRESIHLPGEEQ